MENGAERELIKKLGRKITDRIDVKLGLTQLTDTSPEYYGIAQLVSDEMAELALAMELRVGITPEKLAKKVHKAPERVKVLLEEMAHIGIVEFDRENRYRELQYVLPVFVPGSAELMVKLLTMGCEMENHTEITDMFERLSLIPIKGLTQMIPPGGAGIGMHVIPVESAIPASSKSIDVEHLSHWLKKYDKYSIERCSCRTTARVQNRGSGELEYECCIGVGDMAEYVAETGRGRYATYDEVIDLLKRAEENGYVHQITNIDGEDKIFVICNCHIGTCLALRTSQYYNTPNMSASAYRAHINVENCVACGKCAEVCPAGAVKLGQRLMTQSGPVDYPKQEDPMETPWGEDKWNPDYITANMKNCHDTGTAPCKAACPAHIAVQGYIKMASEGRYDEALRLIKQDNPFPAVCGNICSRKCEQVCTRGCIDKPVAIDEIKRFVAERELDRAHRYIPKVKYHKGDTKPFTEKIAIIGAGPAGLSCAYFLAINGYANITVFDENPVPGGMLMMGIPSFRLEKHVVEAEIDVIRELGVTFRCGVKVGRDISVEQLRDEGYKGFYIAIGAQKSVKLKIPGEDFEGVFGAVDFLRQVNSGKKPEIGKKCAVIGGGNVAMDVCRTAVRLGAENTYIIYRRGKEEMPADTEEIEAAMQEGVRFYYYKAPVGICGERGRVKAIKLEAMKLGEPDENGRHTVCGTGEIETIEIGSVIAAVGQSVDWDGIDTGKVKFRQNGTVVADAVTFQTAESDIFVGGDCHTGPRFAIDAIAAGREGAVSLHRFVHEGQSLTTARNLREFTALDKTNLMIPISSFDAPRRSEAVHDPSKVKSFKNDRTVFTEKMVTLESSRCLQCGVAVVDTNRCLGCGLCTTRCNFDAIHLSRDVPEASRMWKTEDRVKAVAPYAVKRAAKIAIRKIKGGI